MTTTTHGESTDRQPVPTSVPMRFEVTVVPVADVDRAKAFYVGLGWQLDADFNFDEETRVVQLTPTGSPAWVSSSVRTGRPQPRASGQSRTCT